MYYITDENGFYLGLMKRELEGEQFYTDVPIPKFFIKPKFNGAEWNEGALEEEIAEYKIMFTPQEITRRQFKIALALLGKNEQSILNGIAQLPEPNQTIARISYMEAGTFERNNPELIIVATNFLQMDEEEIDQIFITGSQY